MPWPLGYNNLASSLPLIAGEAQAIFDQAATLPDFLVPVFVLGFGLGYDLFEVATMLAGVLPLRDIDLV